MSDLSDEELFNKFKTNPHGELHKVYQRYSGPLFRLVYRFTGNREGTEEILHDVFTELLAGKFQNQVHATLKDWLFTVAKNKSLNAKKKRTREILDNDQIAATVDFKDLESDTIQQNLQTVLVAAEKTLPNELLETWSLRKQGFDHQTIGEKLDIPIGTVKSRFHRIVELLRKEIV